jgi:hypothetical protein
MPLHSIPETELRDHCRRAIEGLELWLRRLIDDRFSAVFGSDYMNAKKPNGDRLIRGSLAKELQERQAKQPDRFPRVIAAAFLEGQIDLICNPDHYRTLFAEALEGAFGAGGDRLREMLGRMIAPRNALYHANPIWCMMHIASYAIRWTSSNLSKIIIRRLEEHRSTTCLR